MRQEQDYYSERDKRENSNSEKNKKENYNSIFKNLEDLDYALLEFGYKKVFPPSTAGRFFKMSVFDVLRLLLVSSFAYNLAKKTIASKNVGDKLSDIIQREAGASGVDKSFLADFMYSAKEFIKMHPERAIPVLVSTFLLFFPVFSILRHHIKTMKAKGGLSLVDLLTPTAYLAFAGSLLAKNWLAQRIAALSNTLLDIFGKQPPGFGDTFNMQNFSKESAFVRGEIEDEEDESDRFYRSRRELPRRFEHRIRRFPYDSRFDHSRRSSRYNQYEYEDDKHDRNKFKEYEEEPEHEKNKIPDELMEFAKSRFTALTNFVLTERGEKALEKFLLEKQKEKLPSVKWEEVLHTVSRLLYSGVLYAAMPSLKSVEELFPSYPSGVKWFIRLSLPLTYLIFRILPSLLISKKSKRHIPEMHDLTRPGTLMKVLSGLTAAFLTSEFLMRANPFALSSWMAPPADKTLKYNPDL